jgi:hypothetical protein
MVETRGCLHPHISTCFGGRHAALPLLLAWTPKVSRACHYRPCEDQEEICFGVRPEAPPQGLRKARAWQRVAARPTRLDLKEAFEYASRSFLNAVALCCDLRCKIKQN